MKKARRNRADRAEKVATKAAYWGLVLGVLFGVGLVILTIAAPQVFSVRNLVMAQVVPKRAVDPNLEAKTVKGELIDAAGNGTNAQAGVPTARTPSGGAATPATGSSDHNSTNGAIREAGFDKLASFRLDITEDMVLGRGDPMAVNLQIPAAVKSLNQKDVAVKGFMLPTKVDHGRALEFLLLKNQGMCCYGVTPKMNEWVTVRVAGQGVKPVLDQPITVVGTLRVGEFRESGMLVGIYRLDADKVELP